MRALACKCGGVRVNGACNRCGWSYEHKAKTDQRGYDAAWKRLRMVKMIRNPLCEECDRQHKVTPAIDVHHIQPIRTHPHLRLEMSNLMSVCRACHVKLDSRGG